MKRKNPKPKQVAPTLPNDLVDLQSRENLMRVQSVSRSEIPTPPSQIKKKPDGKEYVEEAWMRHMLNKHFPSWSWVHAGDNPVQFLGGEWVHVSGTLIISDNGVQRHFFSPGAARVQFGKNKPHTPENVINIDYNVASANANAFKRAVNRLINIADDVYRKQILELDEEEMARLREFFDELILQNPKEKDTLGKIETNVFTKVKAGSINITNVDVVYKELKHTYKYKESK